MPHFWLTIVPLSIPRGRRSPGVASGAFDERIVEHIATDAVSIGPYVLSGGELPAMVLLDAVVACLDALTARARRESDILAVGVTTFWHGLLGFDATGRAITPVYLWADSRSAPDAALLRNALDEAALHARTGCHLHSSYWPAKLRWLAT